MLKNITKNQIFLIIIATVLLLLAAFSLYLLQDLSAPLPFSPPTPSSTATAIPPSPSYTPEPSFTSLPTRQTSYTPFASLSTTNTGTPPESTNTPETASPVPSGTTTPGYPPNTSTIQPNVTTTASPTASQTQPNKTTTVTPTASQTLSAGEHGVNGRVVQNGTPIANTVVEFTDDTPGRTSTTSPTGHYSFITLAPGTTFTLMFTQVDNPLITPVSEIASRVWIEGTLPIGIDNINLPDLEVSLHIGEITFEPQTPTDGATFSAVVISPANPLQFSWTLYNQGESYHVELGVNGSKDPIWRSPEIFTNNWMWNGTLDDGSHISEGNYWWRVAVTKPLGDYTLFVFTHEWDLIFNP
jgi:hypothetical protein